MLIKIITIILCLLSYISIAEPLKTPIVNSYMFEHKSKILEQSRRYMVSLPERYYASERHYPTLYVIDSDFQFQHTSALVTNLSRMGKIPPMIVIGVANQGQQDYILHTTWEAGNNKEYGGASLFKKYLEEDLVPIINQNYRTNTQRALAGYSLGGLFTTYVMMQDSSTFNAFLAMSPSAWFDKSSINEKFSQYISNSKKNLPPLFISVANEEGLGVRKLVDTIKLNYKTDIPWHWQFKTYPKETHFSTAMPAFYDALTFLSPNYYLDPQEMMKLKSYKDVLDTFDKKKSLWTGFQIEWLQAYQLAKYMFWSKQLDHIDNFLAEVKQRFPESYTEVTIQVAKGFTIKEKAKRAQQLLLNIEKTSKNNALWHREMSLSYGALGKSSLAEKHQEKAESLARKQKLPTWLVWELK